MTIMYEAKYRPNDRHGFAMVYMLNDTETLLRFNAVNVPNYLILYLLHGSWLIDVHIFFSISPKKVQRC